MSCRTHGGVMFNYYKCEIAIVALFFSFNSFAQSNICKNNLEGCGIVFSSIAPTPSLSTVNCNNSVTAIYTLLNEGDTPTKISLYLTEIDSLNDPNAVNLFQLDKEKFS